MGSSSPQAGAPGSFRRIALRSAPAAMAVAVVATRRAAGGCAERMAATRERRRGSDAALSTRPPRRARTTLTIAQTATTITRRRDSGRRRHERRLRCTARRRRAAHAARRPTTAIAVERSATGDDSVTIDARRSPSHDLRAATATTCSIGGGGNDTLDGDDRRRHDRLRDGGADRVDCGAGTTTSRRPADSVDELRGRRRRRRAGRRRSTAARRPCSNPIAVPSSSTFSRERARTPTFDCRLDSARRSPTTCTSPFTTPLTSTEGEHTFGVAATDQYGNTDRDRGDRHVRRRPTPPEHDHHVRAAATSTDTRTPTFELASPASPA